jgi:asparagine synthase (glutamine-hydrolysing)
MRDTMTYGGPDDAGLFVDTGAGLALGHRRLSIIDLSAGGHQPMAFEDLVLVYNGEVYNYREIRGELEDRGYAFDSTSDSEVVLKAFHCWGFDAVARFRGMWAFALLDRKARRLVLCRDRMGVKPLYWYLKDGLFMFSSELKAFHEHPGFRKELDLKALSLFLQYGYITSPHSIFRWTRKLEPGCFLVVDEKGRTETRRYWAVDGHFRRGMEERERWLKRGEEEIADELEKVLTEAFNLRMVADVPVGMFLSGGIDSSLVTALLQKDSSRPLKTFTIGFHEEEYNEAVWAGKVAGHLGTEHTELYCTQREAFEIIPRLPEFYDEPFGDSSSIPTYLVSRLAKEQVKVSLSADGGDEQFCGYTRYWMTRDGIGRLPLKPRAGAVLGLLSPEAAFAVYRALRPVLPRWTNFKDKYTKFRNALSAPDLVGQYDVTNKYFVPEHVEALGISGAPGNLDGLDREFMEGLDPLSMLMYVDHNTYLPDDILVKVDRATMQVSLEGREPFLDNRVLEFSAAPPNEFKYSGGVSKRVLRNILYRYVPRELIERPKQGFGVPVYEWFKDELGDLFREYLSVERIRKRGVMDADAVEALVEAFFHGRGVNVHRLWFLLVFEMWAERWMGD